MPIYKTVGIYKLTEEIVMGINKILFKYNIPFFPYLHCFLTYGEKRLDLSDGNCNGKKRTIGEYIYIEIVRHDITPDEEFVIYLKIYHKSFTKIMILNI
ncbi:MAG: hypothetical protein JXB50_15965 [Spirochaetes bacterium]|nr:hypothetical protein [Spirochaetota bacterium]